MPFSDASAVLPMGMTLEKAAAAHVAYRLGVRQTAAAWRHGERVA
ncbi:hypothetical protein [Agromyces badenianii]|nr:hypothetical protein [Agromyces badenianii]